MEMYTSCVCYVGRFCSGDNDFRAQKYSNICKILSDQGMWVIICTVALFDSIREWNRKNIDGYIEVFTDTPYEILRLRNKKGVYADKENHVELFENVEFPKKPDVVTGKSDESILDSIERIMKVTPASESEYDRDREYWNSVYKKNFIDIKPSDFARSVINDMLLRDGGVLELGCGNGRDSLFFYKMDCVLLLLMHQMMLLGSSRKRQLDVMRHFFMK